MYPQGPKLLGMPSPIRKAQLRHSTAVYLLRAILVTYLRDCMHANVLRITFMSLDLKNNVCSDTPHHCLGPGAIRAWYDTFSKPYKSAQGNSCVINQSIRHDISVRSDGL